MAKYVIPPKAVIVKCRNCTTLYVPDQAKNELWYDETFKAFEKCPVCGYDKNGYRAKISLWRYNLIRLIRGGFRIREEDENDEQETDSAL